MGLVRYITGRILLLAGCYFGTPADITGQLQNIKNDVFWNTIEGQPIYSQGGGIFRFKDRNFKNKNVCTNEE